MLATVLVAATAAVLLTGLAMASLRLPKPLRCIGCGRAKPEVPRLVTGPNVGICPDCIGKAIAATAELQPQRQVGQVSVDQVSPPPNRCIFCHGVGDGHRTLITMTNGAICNQCLSLCQEILAEEAAA